MKLSRRALPAAEVIVAVAFLTVLAVLVLGGCTPRVKVDPIEVKPIHIVHDINIRVERQLDEFFAFQDQPAAATQPTTNPTTQTVSAGDAR